MEPAAPAQYDPITIPRFATIQGYATALRHFDDFLATLNMPDWTQCQEQYLCDKMLFSYFCSYLAAYSYFDDEPMKANTAQQYFSGVKTKVKEKFPDNPIWSDEGWITEMRSALLKSISNRFIEEGMCISSKADPIGRALLIKIGGALLSRNDTDSVERRAVLMLLYHAIGRGGEVGMSAWNLARWDLDEECIVFNWSELKTSAQKLMTVHADYTNFEVCCIHSLACYFCVGGGRKNINASTQKGQWIFPQLSNLKNGCASNCNTYIKDLIPPEKNMPSTKITVSGLSKDMSSHSLRIGSANMALSHPDVKLVDVILRGGWDFTGDSNIFNYLQQCQVNVTVAGKALAGWPNARGKAYAPRCVFVNKDNAITVDNFIHRLFNIDLPEFDDEAKLKPLSYVMFASLLMNLDAFIDTYKASHTVVKNMLHVAKTFGFNSQNLMDWGKEVRDDWIYRCHTFCSQNMDLQTRLDNVEHKYAMLQQNYDTLSMKFDKLHTIAVRSFQFIEDIHTSQHSPIKKRQRVTTSISSTSSSSSSFNISPIANVNGEANDISDINDINNTYITNLNTDIDNSNVTDTSKTIVTNLNQILMNNAKTQIIYKLESMCKLQISKIFLDYYEYKLYDRNTAHKIKPDDWLRIRQVVWFMKSLANENELAIIASQEPEKHTKEWKPWNISINKVAIDLQERLSLRLQELEGIPKETKTRHTLYVSAIQKRMCNLVTQRKLFIPSNI